MEKAMPMLMVRGFRRTDGRQILRRLRERLREATVSVEELKLDGVQDVEVWFPDDLLNEQDEICVEVREMWKKTGADERGKEVQDKLASVLAHKMRDTVGPHKRIFCFCSDQFDDKTQGYCLLEAESGQP